MAAIGYTSQARATALTRVGNSVVPAGQDKFSTHRCSPSMEHPATFMPAIGYMSQARATAVASPENRHSFGGGQILDA